MKKQIASFQIQDMLPIGLTLVVLGIGLAFGLNVLGDIKSDMSSCPTGNVYNSSNGMCSASNLNGTHIAHPSTAQFNATGDAMTGVAKLPAKLPLIVTVIVAAIIIGILVRYLLIRFR